MLTSGCVISWNRANSIPGPSKPVASRYTDYATRPTFCGEYIVIPMELFVVGFRKETETCSCHDVLSIYYVIKVVLDSQVIYEYIL